MTPQERAAAIQELVTIGGISISEIGNTDDQIAAKYMEVFGRYPEGYQAVPTAPTPAAGYQPITAPSQLPRGISEADEQRMYDYLLDRVTNLQGQRPHADVQSVNSAISTVEDILREVNMTAEKAGGTYSALLGRTSYSPKWQGLIQSATNLRSRLESDFGEMTKLAPTTPKEPTEHPLASLERLAGRKLSPAELEAYIGRQIYGAPREPGEPRVTQAQTLAEKQEALAQYKALYPDLSPADEQRFLLGFAPTKEKEDEGDEQAWARLLYEQERADERSKLERELRNTIARMEERSRLEQAISQVSLQASMRAIPPGMEFVPGFEPGGPMEALYQGMGLSGFTPQKATGYAPDISGIQRLLAELGA